MAGEARKPAPRRTLDQRLRALRQANEVRVGRARLKKELAAGEVRIEEVLTRPPEVGRTAKVYALLLALPKVGPAKASRSLSRCRIAPSKTVSGLSERQREELITLLGR